METKRVIYLTVFTVFGILIGFVLHMLLELIIMTAIERQWHFLTAGMTTAEWEAIRYAAFLFWMCMGMLFGYVQGKYWWDYLYGHDVVVEPRTAKRKRAVIFVVLALLVGLWYVTWQQ